MRLVDCFVKPLAYTAYIVGTSGDKPPCFAKASHDIRKLLAESAKLSESAGFMPAEYDEARFAVCAWIDEAILCSSLPERDLWMGELLQRKFYNTTRAGEELFTRLQELNDETLQVRDVYYHCLALGFKGRYFASDLDGELDRIKKENLKMLKGNSSMLSTGGNLMGFFPDAYPHTPVNRLRRMPRIAISYVTFLMIVVPIIFILLTYFSYSHSLDGLMENLIRQEFK